MRKSQRYLLAGSLGFVAMAIIMLALLLVTALSETGATTPSTSAAATKAPTATPTPILHVASSQGWVNVPQTNFVYDLVFSTGHPLDGYACSGTFGKNPQTFSLHVTHNGGLTWAAMPLALGQAEACSVQVNPTNSNDILVSAVSCYIGCDGSIPYFWMRSLDGGKTWTKLHYSAADEAKSKQVAVVSAWYYAGNDLYCYLFNIVQSGYPITLPQPLGVSVNGGAFTWMDNAALAAALHIASTDTTRLSPQTWKNTFFFYERYPATSHSIIATQDGGQTWNAFVPQVQGASTPDFLEVVASTPTTMYAGFAYVHQATAAYYQSTDGGHTWSPFALMLPTRTSLITITPDGTIFASTTTTLLCQAPGGTTWQPVATYIQSPSASPYISQYRAGLSWDNAGHPIADWAFSGMYSATVIAPVPQTQVLAYHAAACGHNHTGG